MTITPLGIGTYHVTGGGRSRIAYAVLDGTRTWIFLDGRSYLVDDTVAGSPARRGSHDDARTALASPMPATVVDVRVAPGDLVARGDILIMLEAMKMELPVRSPRDARVRSVACRAGDLAQPGVPLLELE